MVENKLDVVAERVRVLVGRKGDRRVAEELHTEHVSQGVVLCLQVEFAAVGHLLHLDEGHPAKRFGGRVEYRRRTGSNKQRPIH